MRPLWTIRSVPLVCCYDLSNLLGEMEALEGVLLRAQSPERRPAIRSLPQISTIGTQPGSDSGKIAP
jgi:hypothetical protein